MNEPANMSFSESETPIEWQEARSRLEAYLCALNVTSPQQQQRIISAVLDRAAAKLVQHPAESPANLAMNEFREFTEQWFQKIVPTVERVPAAGVVSYLAVDATRKWPGAFLSAEVPAGLRQALQKCEVRAAPDLMVTRMVPQPFDNVLGDINLPTALVQLTKDLPPSFVAKAIAFVLGSFTLWSGNRLR